MQRRPFFSNPERKHTIKQLSVPGDPLIYSKCGKKFEDDWYRDVHYLQEHSASRPFPNPPEVDGLKDAGNHDGPLGKGKHILPTRRYCEEPESYAEGREYGPRRIITLAPHDNHRTVVTRYSQSSLTDPGPLNETILQPSSYSGGSSVNQTIFEGYPNHTLDSRGSPYRNTLNPRQDSLDSLRTRRDSRDDFSNQNPFADARVYNRTIQSSTGNETSSYGNTPILRPNSFDSLRTRRDSKDGFSNQVITRARVLEARSILLGPERYSGFEIFSRLIQREYRSAFLNHRESPYRDTLDNNYTPNSSIGHTSAGPKSFNSIKTQRDSVDGSSRNTLNTNKHSQPNSFDSLRTWKDAIDDCNETMFQPSSDSDRRYSYGSTPNINYTPNSSVGYTSKHPRQDSLDLFDSLRTRRDSIDDYERMPEHWSCGNTLDSNYTPSSSICYTSPRKHPRQGSLDSLKVAVGFSG
ncbi:hypothetical protein B0J14DRAFT_683635 [Halenospora varia]|nr:hypothetical protein B0J14DRAFT_683635 [Halenospora varia]